MKRKGTPAEGAGFQQSAARLTPLDIQEKTFRTARMSGGYHVREVDEFLDQITDVLSALIAENERLRAAVGKDPGTPGVAAPAPPAATSLGARDRAAVDSFLRHEKAFLQGLGGLVQEHAEALREMARSARRAPSAEEAPERPVQPAAITDVTEMAEPETPVGAPAEEIAPPVEEPVVAAAPAEAGPEAPIEIEGDDVSASVSEVAPQEEPIRLEETQPARSRSESDPEPSLRELFWGED